MSEPKGFAEEFAVDCVLVLNASAKFEAGAAYSTSNPSKLVPCVRATIPLSDGRKAVLVEFEDAQVLVDMAEVLMAAAAKFAFIDKRTVTNSLDTYDEGPAH